MSSTATDDPRVVLGVDFGGTKTAAAAAEVRHGALAGHDPALYLNLGTGLAAALVVGGRVVNGRHGAAGEIAYNLRVPDDLIGSHDGRPALEERVSGSALGRRASS